MVAPSSGIGQGQARRYYIPHRTFFHLPLGLGVPTDLGGPAI